MKMLRIALLAAISMPGVGCQSEPRTGSTIGWSIVENSMTGDQCDFLAPDGYPGKDLHLITVDLDTEEARIAETYPIFANRDDASGFHTWGFVVRDKDLVLSTYNGSGLDILTIHRSTGSHDTITTPRVTVDAFAGDQDGFYQPCGEPGIDQEFCRYPTVADLATDSNAEVLFTASELFATRFTASPTHFYGAWHSTDHILRADRQTGAVTSIPLEDFDGWVDGMSVSGSSLYLSSNRQSETNPWDRQISRFDLVSGRLTGRATIEQNGIFEVALPGGLHCTEAPRKK